MDDCYISCSLLLILLLYICQKPTKFNQSNTLNAYWSLLSNECFASGMMDIYSLVLVLVLDFYERGVGGREVEVESDIGMEVKKKGRLGEVR
jgi:hypothetical protein